MRVWRYVPRGGYLHSVPGPVSKMYAMAICGTTSAKSSANGWLGDRNDKERERAKGMDKCRKCLRALGEI